MRHSKKKTQLSRRQQLTSLWRVVTLSYRAAPSVLYIRLVASVLDSVLPIVTTFFAAQTTTELARAYNGQAGSGQAALTYVVATAALGVLSTVWSQVSAYFSRLARYKLESVVTERLFTQFLQLDFWRYDDKDTANLFDRSRKFSNFFAYVFDKLGGLLTGVVGLITAVIAVGFVSWWLALLIVVAVVPGLLVQYRLSKARVDHWANNMDARRKRYNIEWQLGRIDHIAELRLYGLTRFLLNLYQKYRDKDEKQQIQIERRFIRYEVLATVLEAVAEVVALVYITLRIAAHAQPIGQFIYVQQLVSRGLGSVRQLVSEFINIDEDLGNLVAYDEFMQLPTHSLGGRVLVRPPARIEVRNVSFAYPQHPKPVLHAVSLSIKKGEHVALVGENGAGKSTLVKLLLGLYMPTQGQVLLDEIPTAQLNLESWHAQVGVLQQSVIDFEFATARDNILYGDVSRPVSRRRYDQATHHAEAADFLAKLPKKDDTYITQWMEDEEGDAGVALSGGQQQRLALARNFYRDSPVIILDEPTSAIDALAEVRIFKRLLEEKDKTVITISHRLSTVRRADRIYVMENGQLVEQGTHAELVERRGTYFRLFESQL